MTRNYYPFPAQIPHICSPRGWSALDIPWSCVRVIKPFIGGGFGNKQDVLEGPMAAFLTQQTWRHSGERFHLAVKDVSRNSKYPLRFNY